ncbi:MAG TPA: hypothetical protein VFU02_01390, partial [Polyangiaceae bacterium]|nr:hypothetical protein [Polyangiaceae bacterium]
ALIGSALVVLLVDALSRIATLSGMPSTAPVILSYAVYAVLLVTAVLFMPGGIIALATAVKTRISTTRTPTDSRERVAEHAGEAAISVNRDPRAATPRHGSTS